jgi:NAD(P)H-flavin reductase
MPEYLLELYVPAGAASAAGTGAASVREAAAAVASKGTAVHYLRSIYVAADETCFVLLEAETAQIAQEVARLADVPSNRVSEVASDSDSDQWAGR